MALSTALLTLIGVMFAQAADQPPCDNEDEAKIYWTENANKVRYMRVGCKATGSKKIRWNKTPPGIENVVKGIGAGNNLRQIAVDAKHVFWTDMKNHRIMRASLDPPNDNVVNSCAYPWDNCSAIVEGKKINKPVGLAVEPDPDPDQEPGVDLDWIYWSDQSTREIWKARKDGTEQTLLLSYPDGIPTWLALAGDTLYFTDWLNKKIMKVNKNTPSPVADVAKVVVDANMVMVATTGYFDPFGIAVHENENENESESESEIYWANKAGGKIQKMSLEEGTITTLVNLKMSMNPLGLALDVVGKMVYWATSAGRKQAIRRVPMSCVDCDAKDPKMKDSVRAEWMSNAGHPAGIWVAGNNGDDTDCEVHPPGGTLYWSNSPWVQRGVIKGIGEPMDDKAIEKVIKLGNSINQIVVYDEFVYIADGGEYTIPSSCETPNMAIVRVNKKNIDKNEFVKGMRTPSGLTVDPGTNWLYFVDNGCKGISEPSLWGLDLDQYDGGIDLSVHQPADNETTFEHKKENTYEKGTYQFTFDKTEQYLLSVKTGDEGPIILKKLMGSGVTAAPQLDLTAFLAVDQKKNAKNTLWLASQNKIQSVDIDKDEADHIGPPVSNTGFLRGIAVDEDNDRLYWVNRTQKSIKWTAIDNPDQEATVLLTQAGTNGQGLALDLKGGKGWVYWVKGTPISEIRRTFVCEDGQISQEYEDMHTGNKVQGKKYETVFDKKHDGIWGHTKPNAWGIALDN